MDNLGNLLKYIMKKEEEYQFSLILVGILSAYSKKRGKDL